MKISGHVDLCGPNLIEGWIYSSSWDGAPIVLQVFVGSKLVGECSADRFRIDLQEAGFGDGHCGFSFPVPEAVSELAFAETKLKLVDTPVYLLPSEFTIFPTSLVGENSGDFSTYIYNDAATHQVIASPTTSTSVLKFKAT